MKEMLKADLEGLFDIATKDAMMAIKEEEDKMFLRMQRYILIFHGKC